MILNFICKRSITKSFIYFRINFVLAFSKLRILVFIFFNFEVFDINLFNLRIFYILEIIYVNIHFFDDTL